jgi:uncharacterized repeat protein (TIGR03803 family)
MSGQHRDRRLSRVAVARLAIAILSALTVVLAQPAQAQSFKVIYIFTGGQDGANPYAGLTMDRAGNLYGTAQFGGKGFDGKGFGTVFKLTRKGSGWVLSPLYGFRGGIDGATPSARVIFGPDGSLYGTTTNGGNSGCQPYGLGCGTVFNLKPPVTACKTALCPWTETVLYRFTGGSDGALPQNGDLLIDQSGIIYGTTLKGGSDNLGVIFSLTPSQGAWTYTVLYSFTGGNDGANPYSGVIRGNAGNLYGTASGGGSYGWGMVYELTPSGSGWQEKTLYSFSGTQQGGWGIYPVGGLIFDGAGNLYGTTESSMAYGPGGTAFELTFSNGSWTVTHYLDLGGSSSDAEGRFDRLAMDAAGNLYGTYIPSQYSLPGEVFKVLPDWTLNGLYAWTQGGLPFGGVVLDPSGNVYGTTWLTNEQGGYGTVYEITP